MEEERRMSLELKLKERIDQYFDEEPIIVPTLFEFIEWLYDILFWEKENERVKEALI